MALPLSPNKLMPDIQAKYMKLNIEHELLLKQIAADRSQLLIGIELIKDIMEKELIWATVSQNEKSHIKDINNYLGQMRQVIQRGPRT